MKNKNEQEKFISCKEVEKALEELENIVREKVDEIDARINSEKHSARVNLFYQQRIKNTIS